MKYFKFKLDFYFTRRVSKLLATGESFLIRGLGKEVQDFVIAKTLLSYQVPFKNLQDYSLHSFLTIFGR